jgi:hypothetical protein
MEDVNIILNDIINNIPVDESCYKKIWDINNVSKKYINITPKLPNELPSFAEKKCLIYGKILENYLDFVKIPNKYIVVPKQSVERVLDKNYEFCDKLDIYELPHIQQFYYDTETKKYYATTFFLTECTKIFNNKEIKKMNRITNNSSKKVSNIYHNAVINIDPYFSILDDSKLKINELNRHGLTPIESAINSYSSFCQKNLILEEKMFSIIEKLSKCEYFRNPMFYAKIFNIPKINSVVGQVKTKYNIIIDKKYENIEEINLNILQTMYDETFFSVNDFIEYFKYIGSSNYLTKLKVTNLEKMRQILKLVQCDSFLEKYLDNCVLYFGTIDLYNSVPTYSEDFLNTVMHELISNNKFVSVLYLLKTQNIENIKNIKISDSLLQNIAKDSSHQTLFKLESFLKLFYKYGHKIIDSPIEKTLLTTIATLKPNIVPNVIELFTQYSSDFLRNKDLNGDTVLHILCRNNNYETIIELDSVVNSIVNIQDSNGRTPIMLSMIVKNDKMYDFFKKCEDCDDMIVDNYGNTVYHYMCFNKQKIGETIKLSSNNYGYTPLDYTYLKKHYYVY